MTDMKLGTISNLIRKHIYLPNDADYFYIEIFIVGTYLPFEYRTRNWMIIHGPHATGKSLLLQLLSRLVHNPIEWHANSPAAVAARSTSAGTHIIDGAEPLTPMNIFIRMDIGGIITSILPPLDNVESTLNIAMMRRPQSANLDFILSQEMEYACAPIRDALKSASSDILNLHSLQVGT